MLFLVEGGAESWKRSGDQARGNGDEVQVLDHSKKLVTCIIYHYMVVYHTYHYLQNYRLRLLRDSIEENFRCGICIDIPVGACVTSGCNHLFCTVCLKTYFRYDYLTWFLMVIWTVTTNQIGLGKVCCKTAKSKYCNTVIYYKNFFFKDPRGRPDVVPNLQKPIASRNSCYAAG
jgi:hypothetical protein